MKPRDPDSRMCRVYAKLLWRFRTHEFVFDKSMHDHVAWLFMCELERMWSDKHE